MACQVIDSPCRCMAAPACRRSPLAAAPRPCARIAALCRRSRRGAPQPDRQDGAGSPLWRWTSAEARHVQAPPGPLAAPGCAAPDTAGYAPVPQPEVSAMRYLDKAGAAFYDAADQLCAPAGRERASGGPPGRQRWRAPGHRRCCTCSQPAVRHRLPRHPGSADAVVVPVNPMNLSEELRHYRAGCRARTILAPQDLGPRCARCCIEASRRPSLPDAQALAALRRGGGLWRLPDGAPPTWPCRLGQRRATVEEPAPA